MAKYNTVRDREQLCFLILDEDKGAFCLGKGIQGPEGNLEAQWH